MFKRVFIQTLFASLFVQSTIAQSDEVKSMATGFITNHQGIFSEEETGSNDIYIASSHISSISDVAHIYFQQTVGGIDVVNAMASVHVDRNNEIFHTTNRLIRPSQFRIQQQVTRNALTAVGVAADHFDLPRLRQTTLVRDEGEVSQKRVFRNAGFSSYEIPGRLAYIRKNDQLVLSWEVILDMDDLHEKWAVYIDAQSNQVIDKVAMYIECDFGRPHECVAHKPSQVKSLSDVSDKSVGYFVNNSYNVFAIPLEAPNEGNRSVVTEPWNQALNASPFGWHDTDGIAGREFTITRGNNVYAYEDRDGINGTIGTSPDGGANLMFDFPLDITMAPGTYTNGAIVNLFYMNNIVHDVLFQYGFDVPAGNFQTNSYGAATGIGNDALNAEAQDGSDTNNARFFTSADGGQSRMEMYEWVPSLGSATVTANAPASVAGVYQAATSSGFGPQTGMVTGQVIASDHIEACTPNPITNGAALSGNIALIDRGNCNFTEKVKNAQNVGAVAVIICNNIPGGGIFGMGGSDPTITIPSVMMSYEDCQTIRVEIGNGLNVTMNLVDQANTDSDLDNGIIAHEYAHGLSTRLTGGPSTAGCLFGDEQMGEGWSDYIGLMLQLKPGDMGPDPSGIGTYVQGDVPTGTGIRPFPYSTNMFLNPFTYNSIGSGISIPHGVGSVWCTMLWDMTWELIDKHGFDPDYYSTNGGNGIALKLVVEALKLQPCGPGFVTGRDAILAADQALFGGDNQCQIWRAFARRGLGVGAQQGSVFDVTDGVESYERPAGCFDENLGPCDDQTLTFTGVPIPDNTNKRVNTLVTIENSSVAAGANVTLRAGTGFDIKQTFEIAKTSNVFLKAIPCNN